jgi:hypothetical protein
MHPLPCRRPRRTACLGAHGVTQTHPILGRSMISTGVEGGSWRDVWALDRGGGSGGEIRRQSRAVCLTEFLCTTRLQVRQTAGELTATGHLEKGLRTGGSIAATPSPRFPPSPPAQKPAKPGRDYQRVKNEGPAGRAGSGQHGAPRAAESKRQGGLLLSLRAIRGFDPCIVNTHTGATCHRAIPGAAQFFSNK